MDLTLLKDEIEFSTTDKSKPQTESLSKLYAVELGYIGSASGMVTFE